MAWWQIHIIRRSRAEYLGVINAPDERQALIKAIEAFHVRPESRKRLAVTRLNDRDDG
jgi:1,2-phenylacetyl-CoA epoxidase PaaB subunit